MGYDRLAPRLRPLGLEEPRRRGVEARRFGDVGEDGEDRRLLNEAHERQVEEATNALEEGPEGFYKSGLDR